MSNRRQGALAFGGAGSGRSKFQSLGVSAPDSVGGRDGDRKGPYKKRRLLNANFIKKPGDATQDNSVTLQREQEQDVLDAALGFHLYTEGPPKLGWLVNFNTCTMEDKETGQLVSAVACYFMCQTGSMFKCKIAYQPYLYLQVKDDRELEVEAYLRRKFEGVVNTVSIVYREDLSLKNHLAGHQRKLMKVTFNTVQQLMELRKEIMPIIQKNRADAKRSDAYALLKSLQRSGAATVADALSAIEDIKEYDVPYHVRVAIDTDLRAGKWFSATAVEGVVTLTPRPDLIFRGEPRICAFDIETTKLPLHFPNAEHDQVFMISYMIDRQGYLIVNRKVVGGDIESFEYTPKPEFLGPFEVFNEADEKATLERWFRHMREAQPAVYVTYNGDFFDWPFIETRAKVHGLNMHEEIGFRVTKSGECLSKSAVHMDCLCWVNRDSYLPQGSRGLKAVTKAKLGYDPVEVDPEDMVPLAQSQPQAMASYSVSDAVATYYLYMTYIHPFVFSLATIIPMPPDDVLRKGSGTLCEQLLMVEAFRSNVVCPNKHTDEAFRLYKGRLLASETYIGGKVEAIESGVFRSDLPCKFSLQPQGYQHLLDRLDHDLAYGLETECGADMNEMANYEEVKAQIADALEDLRDNPERAEEPLIYHLDVAAMYPNIILTNRLQPSAIVTDTDCAACDFNHPGKACLREMEWVWRGETYMINQSELTMLQNQLEVEKFPALEEGAAPRLGRDLPSEEKRTVLTERIKKYAQRVYKRVQDKPVTETQVAGICQRENGFYIDTVRSFRDRRYEYKGLVKKWKGKLSAAQEKGDAPAVAEAKDMGVLYDSLQLAHKCILNSFYGYVMRKGARWYSMEMAGVTTYTGAKIIERACRLIEQVGRPLELDTDGIWCCLPGSFPEEFKFTTKAGKTHKINYPGLILNVMCAEHNVNPQYHSAVKRADGSTGYEVSSQMSIEFEVDGPYLAMVLPASKEEGKLIKKRYAVFNHDGSLAELKGFEIKRRGELKLIKVFQSEVFDQFLLGSTLEECYEAVAAIANRWLDLIDTRGVDLKDSELIEYFSESCTMSKSLEDYGDRKSTAITTAKRLAQFLGDERIKDKGLACNYIIAEKPFGTPTSDRAIPVMIFSAEPAVARSFLRKWTGDAASGPNHEPPDVREFLDMAYYKERLGSAIQKIITIPAAYQNVANPVPRVAHPEWLTRRVAAASDTKKQQKLDWMFKPRKGGAQDSPGQANEDAENDPRSAQPSGRADKTAGSDREHDDEDMEDFGLPAQRRGVTSTSQARRAVVNRLDSDDEAEPRAQALPAAERVKMDIDYRAWIAQSKEKWRAWRLSKRQQKALGRRGGHDAEAAPAGQDLGFLGEGLQRQMASVIRGTWHIVQLSVGRKANTIDVWALIDTSMHRLHVKVPRTLYIDVDFESSQLLSGARPVTRVLPDGSTPSYLVEMVVPESDLLDRSEEIARMLSTPAIRGVYEARLPLMLKAQLSMTSTARVADRGLAGMPRGGFDLSAVASHPAAAPSYLSGASDESGAAFGLLRYVGLWAAIPAAGAFAERTVSRAVFVMLLPRAQAVKLVLVNRERAAPRELYSVVAEEMWEEIVSSAESAGAADILPGLADYGVSVDYVADLPEAYATLSTHLTSFRAINRGPLLALLEGTQSAAVLPSHMPLLSELPTADCCSAGASAAAASALALRDWQLEAPRAGLAASLRWHAWLRDRVAVARYARVPLCNLGQDPLRSAADAIFARALRAANHLLWSEDPRVPDLALASGGGQDCLHENTHKRTAVNNAGAYRCVCIELKPHYLLQNAILQAPELCEAEGTSLEEGGAGRTLAILRGILMEWTLDASQRNIPLADALLRRMHAWLANPTSEAHHPALLAAIASVADKSFLRLLADLRDLDATVVSATHRSIIIATRKHSLAAASAYANFLISTLARRDLFRWLMLAPGRVWYTLLWRDAFNFAGVLAPKGSLSTDGGTASAAEDEVAPAAEDAGRGGPAYEAAWNLRNFLPPAVHKYFDDVVHRFVTKPWEAAESLIRSEQDVASGSQTAVANRTIDARVLEFLRAWMPLQLLERLFQMTKAISKHVLVGAEAVEARYPRLPGSHLTPQQLGPPALAFVRTVCHVLGLDDAVRDEVVSMYRQLLASLHVREFSKEAAFVDPCRPVILTDVACAHCSAVADLDVTRTAASGGDGDVWACGECGTAYNADTIESLLLQRMQATMSRYELQDLVCSKCREVSRGGMAIQCDRCGGELRHGLEHADVRSDLAVLESIAVFHDLPRLSEAACWCQRP